MTDSPSNSVVTHGSFATRAEIDALNEVLTATIAMAVRTRSVAATALLERARDMLEARTHVMGAPATDRHRGRFSLS